MIKGDVWVMIRKMREDGVSVSEIAKQVGCSRTTVYRYLKKEVMPIYKRDGIVSKLDPFKQYIRTRLEEAPFSAVRLLEEIQKQGYTGKLTILKKFVSEIKQSYRLQAVMRFETMPGQQAQVDWAYFGYLEERGQRKRLYCFLMVLGYSRTKFVMFTTSMDLETFVACHILAFKYFGGVPKEILYDNLKQVVVKRLFRAKESEMNKKFMDFAGYYSFKPILCRVRRPETKGKVENPVRFVRGNFFMGIVFNGLKDLNMQRSAWLEKVNNLEHGTTKEKPFERLKRENLTSIEGKPEYDTSKIFYRTASRECLVHFEGSQYSVPLKYAGKEISVKVALDKPLGLFYRGELICEHQQATEKGMSIINKKHFDGIKELTYKVKKTHRNRYYTRQCTVKETSVEARPLAVYERIVT